MNAKKRVTVLDTTAEPITALEARHSFDVARMGGITAGLRAEGERVRTYKIADDAEEQEAADRLREVAGLEKDLAALIAEAKRPFLDVTQRIDRMVKAGKDDIAFCRAALFSCIEAYRVTQAHARSEAQRTAQQEARARNTPALTTALQTMQDTAPQKLDGVGVKLVWRAEVVDVDAVPREWCVPDERALSQHAAAAPGRANTPPAPIAGVRLTLGARGRVS